MKILQKKIKKPGAWRAGGGRGRGTSRLATRLKILIFQFQYFCTTKFKLKLKQFGHDQTFVRKQTLSTEKSEIFRGVEISSTRFFKSGPSRSRENNSRKFEEIPFSPKWLLFSWNLRGVVLRFCARRSSNSEVLRDFVKLKLWFLQLRKFGGAAEFWK